MAGKKKPEGIALLSVYGGDDDASQASADEDDDESPERQNGDEDADPNEAVSSFALDAEILGSGRASADDSELQPDNGFVRGSPSNTHTSTLGKASTPQPDNIAEGSTVQSGETANLQDKSSREAEEMQVPESEIMDLDVLNDFLPPAPTTKYSAELQTKFAKYLALKKTGKSLNEQLRNTKGYRNPDFLQSAVRHYGIDHIGSCFKTEIFDPHGYAASDYFDSLALEVRREADRKVQERRQSQRIDFSRSNVQGAMAVAKPIVPIVHKVVTLSSSEITVKTDGRSSKKSKWDKVELEGGQTSQSISGAVDAIAAANAHAALLTASANAGAGYASFAQQRRREAEEKLRVTEKNSLSSSKLERKSDRS